jgi:hypothetical protein
MEGCSLPAKKQAFATRLRIVLERKGKQPVSTAKLALQFNLRHPNEPITSQAAHKWITGKSVPAPDKVETLAKWLGVSAHWLRFGTADESKTGSRVLPPVATEPVPTSDEGKLLNGYRVLTRRQKKLVLTLIEELTPHAD